MIKNNLKKLRGNRTQAEAAAALDMSQGVYSMVESGRAMLNKCELVKAMTYYDVPAEKIYPPDILRLCFGIDAAEKKRKPTEKGETMSKYVNVDAFVEALCKTLSTLRKQKDNTPESIAFLKGAQVVAKELMKFPAADVVVRCKNCVHYHPCQVELADGSAPDWGICDQPWFNDDKNDVDEMFYCAQGERREDGTSKRGNDNE